MLRVLFGSILFIAAFTNSAFAQTASIFYSKESPQASYAATMIEESLIKKGYS
jgi:hypothetical protein